MTITVAKLSGYLSAAVDIVWTAPTQDFDSLATDEWSSLSDEIDNSSNLYAKVDMYFDLGSAAFAAGDYIEIFLVPLIHATVYPSWKDNVATEEQENEQYQVGVVVPSAATEVQDQVVRNIPLPPGKYKWGFRNKCSAALNGTNTVSWRPHSLAGDDA